MEEKKNIEDNEEKEKKAKKEKKDKDKDKEKSKEKVEKDKDKDKKKSKEKHKKNDQENVGESENEDNKIKRSKMKPLLKLDSKNSTKKNESFQFNKKEKESKQQSIISSKNKNFISSKNEKKEKLVDIISQVNEKEKVKKIDEEKKKDVDKSKTQIVEKSTSKKLNDDPKVVELKKKNLEILNEIQNSFYIDISKKRSIVKYITESGNFDTRNRDIPFYIILPNSRIKRFWQFLLTFFLLYCLLIIPVDVGLKFECITEDKGKSVKLTYTICSMLFFFDIFLNFISAYLNEKNQYVYDIKLIAINYLKGNFIFDCLSAFPFDKIEAFDETACFSAYIPPSKIYLMFNLLRFLKLALYIEIVEEIFSKYINIVRIIKIFFTLIYLAHLLGNIIFGFSTKVGEVIFKKCTEKNLINLIDLRKCQKDILITNFSSIYFFNVFLGFYFLTGNEYTTNTNLERIVSLFILIISLGLNASIFGNVAVVLSKMSVGLDPFIQEKVDIMKEYMNFMKFDKNFIETIEEYHVNIWMKQRNMMYPEGFFSNLSMALQKLIFLQQWKPHFFEISRLLPKISKDFFSDILPLLKPKIYMKKDIIITEGENNYNLYMMNKNGSCSVKIGGEWITNMGYGEFFGEISIFLRSKRRTATVISEKDADFLSIDGEDYEKMLQDYPEDYETLKSAAKERLLRNIKIYPSKLFAKLVPKNDLKDYLLRKCIYLEGEEEDEFFEGKVKEEQFINKDKVSNQLEECSKNLTSAKQNLLYLTKLKNENEQKE